MPTIKAFIRTTTKDSKYVNVRFRLTDGRKIQMFHKSEIKVNPNDFDPKKETIKAKIVFDNKNRKDFNDRIADRKKLISEIYLNSFTETAFTSEWLENEIDKRLNPNKHSPANSDAETKLLAFIDNFITQAPERKKKQSNTYIRKSTIKSYKANRNRINAFIKFKGVSDILLSEIDDNFILEYSNFLTEYKRTVVSVKGQVINEVRQYTNNTIGDAIKTLKTILAEAPGIKANLNKAIVLKEDVDSVFLNEEELKQLKDYDFSDKPHLERIRDGFLCLAWTCSRISDIGKINKVNNGMIQYNQQKTGNKVVIPLHPVVKEVLNKYNGQIPLTSDKNFNEYIKEACKIAGINSPHTITRTVGGKTISETAPKYEFVSSHSGRRSFCTNMYLRGLDTLMIRSISGHKTEKSFLKYIKVSQMQHAELMAKKWSEIY